MYGGKVIFHLPKIDILILLLQSFKQPSSFEWFSFRVIVHTHNSSIVLCNYQIQWEHYFVP